MSVGSHKIYNNVNHLLNENNNLKTDDKIIIYLINGQSGFGSQLVT